MSKPSDWVWILPSSDERRQAEQLALSEHHMLGGRAEELALHGTGLDGRRLGAVGVVVVQRFLQEHGVPSEVLTRGSPCDLRVRLHLPIEWVDVKTKSVRTQPQTDYVVEVKEAQLDNPVGAYMFCYHLEPRFVIIGWKGKADFLQMAERYTKGERRTGRNGAAWTCSEDCRLLGIRDLEPPLSLLVPAQAALF